MKSKNVLSWLMCALWVSSCITAPVRPENVAFEKAGGSRSRHGACIQAKTMTRCWTVFTKN
jgi:hypothetical protein